ncbi:MAG: hypothetical protein GX907_02265 [Clostridiaceae bacterium]|nr:hypothetical protein [Clostridiaceae bacterium]
MRRREAKFIGAFERDDNLLSVLEDTHNGDEYYLLPIGQCEYEDDVYTVFSDAYTGRDNRPRLTILRVVSDVRTGELLYEAVRSRRLLRRVFDKFYDQYTETYLRDVEQGNISVSLD